MKYLKYPILYLNNIDFKDDKLLELSDSKKHLPVIIMIQSSNCSKCFEEKSKFQSFCKEYEDKVLCATIEIDGKSIGEQKLANRLLSIKPDFVNVPEYMMYKNGKRINENIKSKNLKEFL